ncbi:uncharacterized protein LOC113340491 [Papaver somniferum]|uniref:uncharacterized protein LOC113340491 n=1 Tax=Papaver somniferum TaxID=3469 RepID=UPI000E6F6589|nr:uncharacterized protein LOC113340491 [Papaver somniferum]
MVGLSVSNSDTQIVLQLRQNVGLGPLLQIMGITISSALNLEMLRKMGGGKDQHNSSDKGLMSNLGSWISWSCRRTWSLEGIQITLPGIILPNKGDTLRHQVVTPQQEYPPAILQPGGYPLSLPISLEIALCLFLEARQQQIYVLYAIMCWNLVLTSSGIVGSLIKFGLTFSLKHMCSFLLSHPC